MSSRYQSGIKYPRAVIFILVAVLLHACSSDSTPAADTSPKTLQDTLNLLGVDTEITPRLDENRQAIPDSYAPMGRTMSIMQVDNDDGTTSLVMGVQKELFLAGMRTLNCLSNDCQATIIDDAASVSDYENSPGILYQRTQAAPWIDENLGNNAVPETRRDAAGVDVDGDGRSELVIVYYDAALDEVRVSIADSDAPGAPVDDVLVPLSAAQFPVADLRVVAGNFDNDIEEEFAIGVGSHSAAPFNDSRAYVLIVDGKSSNYALINQINIAALDPSRSISLVLEAAQLDFDGDMELVVVQNELGSDPVNEFDPVLMANVSVADAEAYYTILDNVGSTATVLKAGHIEANVEIPPATGLQTKRARIADVAVGDTDDDTLDEIYFAGLVTAPFSGKCDPVGHLLISLEDKSVNFKRLTESYADLDYNIECPEFNGWRLRFAHVNLLDIDGDTDLEIQVNQFIFDAPPEGYLDWNTVDIYAPAFLSRIMFRASEGGAFFDRSNHVIAIGDTTGDGREDIVTYLQGESEIKIFGVDAADNTLKRLEQTSIVPTSLGGLERNNPIIVPMNADNDTSVYALTGHEFAITEPVVLGVLAAPPCQTGVGQNIDDCTTTWGQATSIGVEREKGFEVSASAYIGFNADNSSCVGVVYSTCTSTFEIEMKATLEAVLARSRSESYELTKSIAFTTGPIEDSVVFTSIPIDTYNYTLLSKAVTVVNGGLVDLVVAIPREPVMKMTQISFYNESVIEDRDRISDDVFQHTPGEIDTYPTPQQKDTILTFKRSQLEDVRIDEFAVFNPIFDDDAPLDALEGLEVGPVSVGQGSGSTELGLDLAKEESLSVTHELNFSLELSMAIGPGVKLLVGGSVGFGVNHTLNVSKGSSTSYQGTIGSIDAVNYVDNQYQFGLFTYLDVNPETGREFEVINYWVE